MLDNQQWVLRGSLPDVGFLKWLRLKETVATAQPMVNRLVWGLQL